LHGSFAPFDILQFLGLQDDPVRFRSFAGARDYLVALFTEGLASSSAWIGTPRSHAWMASATQILRSVAQVPEELFP
jgi:hypothetical protein